MAVMAAKWIGDAFGKEGIYSLWIAMRKYPWLPPLDYRDNGEVAGQFMVPFANLVVVEDGITLEDLVQYKEFRQCHSVEDNRGESRHVAGRGRKKRAEWG